jgi:hypothetical protein
MMTDVQERARRALAAAFAEPSSDQRRRWFDEFMIALEDVGRAWPALAGDSERAFLAETAPLLAQPESPLWMWLLDARDRVSPIEPADDIAGALHDRSALQFLLDLYRDTPAGDALAEVETERYDEEVRQAIARGPAPPVPDGVPASHWWWSR